MNSPIVTTKLTRMGNLYWLLAGALLGFGLMAVFSVGIPIFLLGLVLVLYRLRRAGDRGFGFVLIGMGLLPAVYLSARYLTAGPNEFYPDNTWAGILVYVALALAGGVLVLIEARRSKRQPHHES
ncbi:MAG: hypothetical protein ABI670_17755 [Chloroflexota bacterium]